MDIEELKKLAGIDEKDIERRKNYFLISGRDEELLRRLGEVLDKHADEVIDAFYEHLLGFEETRKFFPDAATVKRVKVLQKNYFKRLTKGEYDLKYFEGRMRIGVIHDRLTLLPKWYIGAFNKYLQIVMPLVFKELGYKEETVEMLESFVKIIFYDMSIAIIAYISAREAKLRESEEKFRSLFEQSNDVIFIHELDGRLIDVNERVVELLGYRKEEILKIPVPKLFLADEYPKFLKAFDEINKRGFVHFESALLRKNGERVFVDVNSRIVEFGGQRVVQMIIRDITERKKAEEDLRERLKELETFHRVAVGRELKMVELKEQIERLEAKIKELESSRAALPYR